MAQAAQRGVGVTVPGDVQELYRCDTEKHVSGYGLDGLTVGLGDCISVFQTLMILNISRTFENTVKMVYFLFLSFSLLPF